MYHAYLEPWYLHCLGDEGFVIDEFGKGRYHDGFSSAIVKMNQVQPYQLKGTWLTFSTSGEQAQAI